MNNSNPSITDILFLDIETVPQYPSYGVLPEEWKLLWDKKAQSLIKDRNNETPETVYGKAAMFAEFGKIVCISCGIIHKDKKTLSLKSFYNEDEGVLLKEFCDMLKSWGTPQKVLCAHNGKEFDFPFIAKRLIINKLSLPSLLQIAGKKPWEIQHLDTMEMWKFGDYKNYISLNLLAHTLGIPTPKDDIDGSMVGKVFWQEKDLPRIVTYCQKDVITIARVYICLFGEEPLF